MAYRDLQEFMRALEKRGLLRRISVPVNRDLEIAEIYDRVVKKGGPALLFERVEGSAFPVLINAFGSMERMALALGTESLDDIAARIAGLLDLSNYSSLGDKIRAVPTLAKTALSLFPIRSPLPAPCKEVIESVVDLDAIPVLKCWPGDGGRFFTLPIVITKDPETGRQNMGMYRLQVFDSKTTGMHWHLHKDGRAIYDKYRALRGRGEGTDGKSGDEADGGTRMPVAVALGCDPAIIYAATAPLPDFVDEAMFAGFLRGSPIETVRCETVDIDVPARAEFILEGYVDLDEPLRTEGPFGDHTGYYSLAAPYPAFHVTCVTRRRNPVYNATVVGRPPMEDCFLGKATERIFLPLLKIQLPEIVDIDFPLEGVFHDCLIVAIRKRYPMQAKKVMHGLWGTGQAMYTKLIIVVDEDVSPHDYSRVAWKLFNNIDAGRDVVIVEGPLDALDHASPNAHFGRKMGIDATKKWKEEGYPREWPDDIAMSPSIKGLVDRRLKEYGLEDLA
jgi:4-hydroxy-3-polyprenylbenzoate decarboxylase